MADLDGLRREIDAVDAELVALLNRRAGIARRIGDIKRERGSELYVPSREREVLEKVCRLNGGPLPNHRIADIYRAIMTASLALEGIRELLVLASPAMAQAVRRFVGGDVHICSRPDEASLLAAWRDEAADYAAWPVHAAGEALWRVVHEGEAMLIGGVREGEDQVVFMRRAASRSQLKHLHIAVIRPRADAGAWRTVAVALGPLEEWWGGLDDASGRPVLLARMHSREESATLVRDLAPWVEDIALLQL